MNQENPLESSSLNLSPYPISETPNGFAFTTDQGDTYRLDFTADSGYLPDTPFADLVYSFSIIPVSGTFSRKDSRVELTVVSVLQSLFKEEPKVVLLYVCSIENDQEEIRRRLFNRWFSKHEEEYAKYDFNYPEQRMYMSAIVRQDFPERWRVELMILQAVENVK